MHCAVLILAAAGLGSGFQAFKIKDVQTPSRDAYVQLAQAIEKEFLAAESPQAQATLGAITQSLANDTKEGLTSVAGAMGTFGQGGRALVLAARAAVRKPDDALAANNLGALLHRMDRLREATQVLLYAKKLAPTSALVATNLGNVAVDAMDLQGAEAILKEAVRAHPKHCQAVQSLGLLFLRQKKTQEAFTLIGKTMQCSSTRAAGRAMNSTGMRDAVLPPEPPPGQPTPPDPTVPGPDHQFIPPPFPYSPDLEAFASMADRLEGTAKQAQKVATEAGEDAQQRLKQKLARLKSQASAPPPETPPGTFTHSDESARFLAREFTTVYKERLDKAEKDFRDASQPIDDDYDKGIAQIGEMEVRLTQNFGNVIRSAGPNGIPAFVEGRDAYLQALATFCKQKKDVMAQAYTKWRDVAHKHYDARMRILKDFEHDVEPMIDQIDDDDDRNVTNDQHVMDLLGGFAKMQGSIAGRSRGYLIALTIQSPLTPHCVAPPPLTKEAAEDLKVDREAPHEAPCPFKGKLVWGVTALKLKLSCESAEVQFGEGVIGDIKMDFKHHEMTGFIGVGGGDEVSAGAGSIGWEAKVGISITVDTATNSLKGVAATATWEESMGLDTKGAPGLSVALEAELKVGVEVSADWDLTPKVEATAH
jgi:Flp pilus assembly protein TadD